MGGIGGVGGSGRSGWAGPKPNCAWDGPGGCDGKKQRNKKKRKRISSKKLNQGRSISKSNQQPGELGPYLYNLINIEEKSRSIPVLSLP